MHGASSDLRDHGAKKNNESRFVNAKTIALAYHVTASAFLFSHAVYVEVKIKSVFEFHLFSMW